jgi:hypothetical protein
MKQAVVRDAVHSRLNGSDGVLGNAHVYVTSEAWLFHPLVAEAGSIDLGTCGRMNRLD